MGLPEALISLNEAKEAGVIQDYAIGGGYAVGFYDDEGQMTYDLDVLVLLPKEDLSEIFEYYRAKKARIKNLYVFVEDMPLQFLPNYISPLYDDAIQGAQPVDFGGTLGRFVTIEHLILLLLTAFRPKDRIRIRRLLLKANKDQVLSLIERFDNEDKLLSKRYQKLLERA